ncbi:LamG-like jellyroll fold domain-containing protein [Actinacidiphila alni]|uniref:LamG-like jellyroll fold domain-containing protein n=1 Tax=Actinacidiphila alni TaxID=380248 RepID=UPI0033F78AF2
MLSRRARRSLVAAVAAVLVTGGLVPLGAAGQAVAAPPGQTDKGSSLAKSSSALTQDAAEAKAAATGADVEITSMRSESAETYATADGNLEVVQHLRPVRARVAGAWQPVDNTLAVTGQGTVVPKAATVGIAFSGGGSVPLVSLDNAGKKLAYTWPGPLPVPVLDGDTATYRNVFPDVDLQMRADTDGFHQLLVVRTAEAAKNPALSQVKLGVQTQGLRLSESSGGGLEATDTAGGGVAFEAPQPVMWDSAGSTGTQAAAGTAKDRAASADEPAGAAGDSGPGDASAVAPIDAEVTADGSELHLTPDQAMLNSADTQFPVYIDPQTHTPKASSWTMVSRYWASSPQWRFNGDSDAGVGFCGWDYCAPQDLKRLLYQFPTSEFNGKTILKATFIGHETHSASCDARDVELWRTKPISSSTTWNTQLASGFWAAKLDTVNVAKGGSGCAAGDVEFNATDGVKYAAAHSTTVAFGLQASNEGDKYAWKRFSDDAYLRVKYNKPPTQLRMSQLSMNPGGTCKSTASSTRFVPTISAVNVTDPDGDQVAVQFELLWDATGGNNRTTHWTSSWTTAKGSGSNSFSVALPTTIPQNLKIGWAARVADYDEGNRYSYSPWSYDGNATACYFVYDNTAPPSPKITSGDYPAVNDSDPLDPSYDGVGRYGTFTLSSTDTGTTKYWYGINEEPSSANTVTTTSGAAKTIKFRPTKSGVNIVYAAALDALGNKSAATSYQFKVKAGQPARAAWKLDDPAGATSAAGSGGERTLDIAGNPVLGDPGAVGSAVTFDGVDDYLYSDIPTVHTSVGFSVAAWVKLSAMPGTSAVVAAQPGNNSPGFELYYNKTTDRWAFNQYTADTATATPVEAAQAAGGGVSAGQWVHLAGVYDSAADLMTLYVNGTAAGTKAYSTPWDARRGLQIGAGSHGGSATSFFPGSIDDVRIYDKPLTQNDVHLLSAKQPLNTGRPARAVFSLDEPAVQDNGVATTVISGSADVQAATYKGGATPGQPGIYGNALTLDGVDDYAATTFPHINAVDSMSVVAWAKLSVKPDHGAMVVTQAGASRPSFELYYSNALGWTFGQFTADAASATLVRAAQGDTTKSPAGVWTQLVGIYDGVTDQMELYVNGVHVTTTAFATPFYSTGGVQLGASSFDHVAEDFFPGQIDDVQLFDRALSGPEVSDLYRSRPVVEGRWMLDTATGSPATSPDDLPTAADRHPLALGSGAHINATGDSNYIGPGGLLLDGTSNGYASTAASPIHTNTSFTVSAWVKGARPTSPRTVLSQAGTRNSAFAVRYVPDPDDPDNAGRWQLDMANADTSTADHSTAEHTSFQDNTWSNITVVYDAFTTQMRLYVDGQLRQSVCADDDGDGTQDDPGCTTKVSWNSDAHPFDAAKGLQIGRSVNNGTFGENWSGAVDDVWVFQGAASDEQIAVLANGTFIPTSPGP